MSHICITLLAPSSFRIVNSLQRYQFFYKVVHYPYEPLQIFLEMVSDDSSPWDFGHICQTVGLATDWNPMSTKHTANSLDYV